MSDKTIVLMIVVFEWLWALYKWNSRREWGWFPLAFACHTLAAFLLGRI